MIQLIIQPRSKCSIGIIVSNAASLHRLGGLAPAPQLLAASAMLLRTGKACRVCPHVGVAASLDCGSSNAVAFKTTGRLIHISTHHLKSMNDVHVTMESSGSNTATTEQTSKTNTSCSQGTSTTTTTDHDEEEMEQEDMFVTADPVLGLGNSREWGGPRRGGSMPEPTRFGDWERKGRCTDFS